MFDSNDDLIAPSVKETIALFEQELSTVTFPDINKQILESLVEQVTQNAASLEEANATALAARETLETSQNDLIQKCTRAIAYAKVYAEDKEELLDKLSKINLGRLQRPSKKSDRTRTDRTDDTIEQTEKKSSRTSKKGHETILEDLSEK